MVNKKTILGGLAALAIGVGILEFKKEPFKLEDVSFGGYSFNSTPGVTLAFYDSGNNRIPLINGDNNFDYAKEFRSSKKYDVKGYKSLFGTSYAKDIQER